MTTWTIEEAVEALRASGCGDGADLIASVEGEDRRLVIGTAITTIDAITPRPGAVELHRRARRAVRLAALAAGVDYGGAPCRRAAPPAPCEPTDPWPDHLPLPPPVEPGQWRRSADAATAAYPVCYVLGAGFPSEDRMPRFEFEFIDQEGRVTWGARRAAWIAQDFPEVLSGRPVEIAAVKVGMRRRGPYGVEVVVGPRDARGEHGLRVVAGEHHLTAGHRADLAEATFSPAEVCRRFPEVVNVTAPAAPRPAPHRARNLALVVSVLALSVGFETPRK